MNAFEVVIIVVAVAAAIYMGLVAFGFVAHPRRVRRGATWIDHPEDVPVSEQPSEDEPSPGIPVGTLRGRPGS